MKHWAEEAPPNDMWVVVRYGVLAADSLVKVCKKGCCVHHPIFGNMTKPSLWRIATKKEITNGKPNVK